MKSGLEKPMKMWYIWKLSDPDGGDEISAQIRIPRDSPWFDGHFPEAPVLPGIAQLGMVHDLLCRFFDRRLSVERVSRVRFKQMIRPDQDVVLTVKTGDAPGSHSFRITGDEGLICNGQIGLSGSRQETPSFRSGE
jgi:3-hydroxyacyl-[acyl-carrier-protein] dehydratase